METIDIQIKSNAPEVTQETTSLRQQVRELRKEMESCAVGSKEYNDALAKLATTTHDFKDQQEAIRNSAGDLGTALSNVQGVATGIVSGFSAVNAVMTLTGSNTEDLQKAMVSLQAGIALVQGMAGLEGLPKKINATVTSLKSLFTATTKETAATGALATSQGILATITKGVSKAFKGLKTALLSSGIGGILVLIGSLATAMTALVGVIRNNLQAENEFKETNDKLNESFATQNEALDLQIKYMQADGASTQEIIEAKRKLVQQQKAETEAALANAQARLSQLKNDSAWTKFWHGENKVIKELEKETIPALQATLDKLSKQEANFTADLYVESKKVNNSIKTDSKSTGKAVVDNAEKVANDVKAQIDEVIKKYKEAKNIMSGTQTRLETVSDVDAFVSIFGFDPKKVSTHLKGVLKALATNAYAELAQVRDNAIAATTDEKVIAEINKAYNEGWNELEQAINGFIPVTDGTLLDSFGIAVKDKATEAAKSISANFTKEFNNLNYLYKEGIIDYDVYIQQLSAITEQYNSATKKFNEEYIEGKNLTAERVEELEYQMAIKPLEFQKEVGERFLQELDSQLAAIENEYFKSSTILERDIINWQTTLNTTSGQWSTSLWGRHKTELDILNAQRDIETEYYSKEKGRLVEELNNNMLTVEQRAGLWAQIEQLDADHLVNKANFNAKEKALNEEWKANLVSTGIEGLNAFASLTSSLNAVSKAQVDEYKRLYDAGKISKEKFEKLQNEELEKQASLQKATTIMQTAAGIATVWAQASKFGIIAGPIIASIQTAAYIANMVAQLKSIETAKRAGLAGNDSDGTATAVDTSFTLTSPDAYQNTLSDEVQTDLQANAKDNQRVYVVSSDISNAQNNEKTTVTTATF